MASRAWHIAARQRWHEYRQRSHTFALQARKPRASAYLPTPAVLQSCRGDLRATVGLGVDETPPLLVLRVLSHRLSRGCQGQPSPEEVCHPAAIITVYKARLLQTEYETFEYSAAVVALLVLIHLHALIPCLSLHTMYQIYSLRCGNSDPKLLSSCAYPARWFEH